MNKIEEILIGTNNEGKYKEICDLFPHKVKKRDPKKFEILNSFGEYFLIFFDNKSHNSLYFPLLFVPIIIFLIFFILYWFFFFLVTIYQTNDKIRHNN